MVTEGDEWWNKAYYNFTEYTPMLNTDGSLADIMGISVVYVANGLTEDKMHSFVGSKVLVSGANGRKNSADQPSHSQLLLSLHQSHSWRWE